MICINVKPLLKPYLHHSLHNISVYWPFLVQKRRNHVYTQFLVFHYYDSLRLFFWISGGHAKSNPPWMNSVAISGRSYHISLVLWVYGDFHQFWHKIGWISYMHTPQNVFECFWRCFLSLGLMIFAFQYKTCKLV